MMHLIHRNRVIISRHYREILPLRSPVPSGEGLGASAWVRRDARGCTLSRGVNPPTRVAAI